MSTQPSQPVQPSTSSTPRILSILGAVFGAVSILFLPIFFGPVGAILGFIAYAKGDKPLGLWVGIGSIVAMVVGMVLGVLVWSATSS